MGYMGYRKVYLTIEEEEDIQRIQDWRTKEGRAAPAYNAILKEGLGMVMSKELALRQPKPVVQPEPVSEEVAVPVAGRRRRRG